ncbi:baseplate J/gp47 family protein [Streptomyces sp. UC4497]
MRPPAVDTRTLQQLRAEILRRTAESVPEWQPADGDPGLALVRIDARFLELLLERLNRMPAKHLLAFLDLMGVELLPPGAAVAPVVLTPAPDAGPATLVPQGTMLTTVQTETDPAAVFATSDDLTVISARPVAAFTIEPEADRFADRTPMITGADPAVFAPFRGEHPIDHVLYLAPGNLLGLHHPADLTLYFRPPPEGDLDELRSLLRAVVWEAYRAGSWLRLPGPTAKEPVKLDGRDAVPLTFHGYPGSEPLTLEGQGLTGTRGGRWIRGVLRFPRTEIVKVVTDVLGEPFVGVDPPLFAPHPAGSRVRRLTVSLPVTTLAKGMDLGEAFGHIEVKSGAGLRAGDLVMIDFGKQCDYMTLGEVPDVAGPVTIPVTPDLSRSHAPNIPVCTVSEPLRGVTSHLSADTGRGAVRLPRGSFADPPAPGDVFGVAVPPGSDVTAVDMVTAQIDQTTQLPPDDVRVGQVPVDFTQDFLPLGPDPRPGETLHVASAETLAPVERTPTLPSGGKVGLRIGIELGASKVVWEYLDEQTWTEATTVDDQAPGAAALNADGPIVLALPSAPTPAVIDKDGTKPEVLAFRARLDAPAYRRVPCLRSFSLDEKDPLYVFTSERPRGLARAGNQLDLTGLVPIDLTENYLPFGLVPAEGNTVYFLMPPESVRNPQKVPGDVHLPHTARVSWEYSAREGWKQLGESTASRQGTPVPSRTFSDTTRALTRSGTVEFTRPRDLSVAEVAGVSGHWLRARLVGGEYGRQIELVQVSLDDPGKGFRIRQGTGALNPPVIGEIGFTYVAGSRSLMVAARNLFAFADHSAANSASRPYRPFAAVEESEPTCYVGFDRPPPNDAVSLYAAVPPRSYVESLTPPGEGNEAEAGVPVWEYWNGRRWNELGVSDGTNGLTESGMVRFVGPADLVPAVKLGQSVPLAWIRVRLIGAEGGDSRLLTGLFVNGVEARHIDGGPAGNRPAGAISRLATSNPLLAAVANPERAAGGAQAETLREVQERGPQLLRHQKRAVTAEDFEWLARQAAGTSVARARCLLARDRELRVQPGWVTVIVVPQDSGPRPLPSAELIRLVEDDLERRALVTLTDPVPPHVNVIGPGYVPVELEVEVRPSEPARPEAARRAVRAAIDRFLHPLTGGPDGDGWAFGRDVFHGELFALVENLPEVDHVHRLAFRPTVATVPLRPAAPPPGPYAAGTRVDVLAAGRPAGLTAVLAESTPARVLMLTVFQEGERVGLGAPGDAVTEVSVRSISGDALAVDPFRAPRAFPSGTPVLGHGGGSVLTAPIAAGDLVAALPVRGFRPGDALRFPEPPDAVLASDDVPLGDRLRVPEFALVHSGDHVVHIAQS